MKLINCLYDIDNKFRIEGDFLVLNDSPILGIDFKNKWVAPFYKEKFEFISVMYPFLQIKYNDLFIIDINLKNKNIKIWNNKL